MNTPAAIGRSTLAAPRPNSDPPVSGLSRVASSGAILLIENVVRIAATAAASLWVARGLGPEAFGALSFAMALFALFLVPSSLGMELPLVLRVASSERPGTVLGTALVMRAGASVIAFLLAAGVAFALRHGQGEHLAATLIVAMSILGYAPSVFDTWFKAKVLPRPAALARLFTTFCSFGAKLAVLAAGGGLIGIAWTVVFEAVLYSLVMFLAWRRSAGRSSDDPVRADVATARALWRDSAPYLVSSIVTILYMKLDVLMLGVLSSSEQTGLYGLAQKLTEVLAVVPLVLLDSALPLLARRAGALRSDSTQPGQLLFDLASASAWITATLAVSLTPVIAMSFGPAFAGAAPLFGVLAWTGIAVALSAARHRWLAVVGLQRYTLWFALQGAVVNTLLNIVLVPHWGASGAAVAALVTSVVAGFASSFAIAATRPIGRMQWRALWPWGRLWAVARAELARRGAR